MPDLAGSDADARNLPGADTVLVDAAAVAAAVGILAAARRPLVIAGGGAVVAGCKDRLRQVAEHLGAVTTTTQMGTGVLPSNGALFAAQGGVIGGPAVIRAAQEADVVLAVGCRFSSWWWRDGYRLVRDAEIVQIDTDPAALQQPGTYGLLGGAQVVLERLWDVLRDTPPPALGDWARDVHADFVAHRGRLGALADRQDVPAHPAALARILGDLIRSNDLVVLDGGHTTFWSNDFTPALRPRTVFHEPGMGHLGFGMPYANALALADRSKRVVTITGDGAFGFRRRAGHR